MEMGLHIAQLRCKARGRRTEVARAAPLHDLPTALSDARRLFGGVATRPPGVSPGPTAAGGVDEAHTRPAWRYRAAGTLRVGCSVRSRRVTPGLPPSPYPSPPSLSRALRPRVVPSPASRPRAPRRQPLFCKRCPVHPRRAVRRPARAEEMRDNHLRPRPSLLPPPLPTFPPHSPPPSPPRPHPPARRLHTPLAPRQLRAATVASARVAAPARLQFPPSRPPPPPLRAPLAHATGLPHARSLHVDHCCTSGLAMSAPSARGSAPVYAQRADLLKQQFDRGGD
jgi:hypothetical protein